VSRSDPSYAKQMPDFCPQFWTGLSYHDIDRHQFPFTTQDVSNMEISDNYSVSTMKVHRNARVNLETQEAKTG